MDFGKIFSRALKYPFNVQVFLVMLVVNLVFSYFGLYFIGLTNPAVVSALLNLGLAIPLVIAGIIVSILVTIFLMGLYIDNASKYFSSGRKSLLGSLPTAKKKFFRLLGTYILMMVILVLAILPMIAFAGFGTARFLPISDILPRLASMFIGLAILYAILFFVFLAPYIAVLDKYGVFGSIKTSAKVVSKHKLSMFIFWILYLIIATALGLLSVAVLFVSVSALGIGVLILQSLITTYTTLFAYSAFTNFYLSVKKK